MRDLDPERNRRTRKLKLWHLVLAVVLAALVFGGIRGLTQGAIGSGESVLLGFVGVWILASLALVFIFRVAKLGARATRTTRDRGIERGGVTGFVTWLAGFGVNLVFVVVAMLLVPVLIIGLVKLLVYLAG